VVAEPQGEDGKRSADLEPDAEQDSGGGEGDLGWRESLGDRGARQGDEDGRRSQQEG
jgi:hypothetical protein